MTATATAEGLKVTIDTEQFRRALGVLGTVVKGRSPRPQLLCIHLEGKERSLVMTATDGEVWMRMAIDGVDVTNPGACLLPADDLAKIAGVCDASTFTLEVNEQQRATIAANTQRYVVFGHTPKDFPRIPSPADPDTKPKATYQLPVAAFVNGLAMVFPAAKTEAGDRHSIQGVFVRTTKKMLELAATDSKRLAVKSGKLPKAVQESGVILPPKAVTLLRKLPDLEAAEAEADVPLSITVTDSQFMAQTEGGILIVTVLVDGTFPPYSEVIPKDHTITCQINREELAAAIRSTIVMCDTNGISPGVLFEFDGEAGVLTLKSSTPERGEATSECKLVKYEGESLKIKINPRFVLDGLSALDSAEVELQMKAHRRPMTISVPGFKYVVMPQAL